MKYFQKLLRLLNKRDRRIVAWLILFSIFISAIETIGISAIMPFIEISTNFDNIHSNQYYLQVFNFFGFESEVNFAIVFGLALFGFYVFRGGMHLLYGYVSFRFVETLYVQITKKLFQTYMTMPYRVFTKKNSSYLTKTIITEAAYVPRIVNSVLQIISEAFVIVFLYTLMLIVNWKITIIFTAVILIKILFLTQTITKKLKSIGKIREKSEAQFYEIINRFFGNFKQSKLQDENRIEASKNEFSSVVYKYAETQVTGNYLGIVPKVFLETVGFSLIIILLTTLLYLDQRNVAYILPTLSLFVIALYRLLPSANRIINGYNAVVYGHRAIDIVNEELEVAQEKLGNKIIKFRDKIELTNVNFSYQDIEILSDINLTISKGEKIAFVGMSGSGKTTLLDLIIGLHGADQGEIKIDNILVDESNLQNWRSQIGYIPQHAYLFDGTIAENVCFGKDLDKDLLEISLKQANIFDFLQTQQGINTLVGEGGVQLSGGQRQRVSIARALYGQPEILVLDEATSALDEETEKKIMNEIYQISQDKTLIIIAHRLSTIKGCDKIYQLEGGVLNIQ